MSLAITLSTAADIETYDGLLDFIIAHLELDSETETQLPALLRMAEYRLNRMLTVPERETTASVTTTAGTAYAALPTGFRQLRSAYIDSDYPLALAPLHAVQSEMELSGKPFIYTVSNQSLYFGPTPDAAYTVELTYMAKLDYLSAANQTNWLLSENADAYVYALLIQCEAFLGHDARIPLLEAALVTTMEEINQQGNRYRIASPIRLRSPVCV
jgi:hypothetical protein